ncbi:Gliding motility-associated, C-terminal domain [Flavobacteriaceae bacterium]
MKKLLLLLLISFSAFSQNYTMSNMAVSTCAGFFYDSNTTGNYANDEIFTKTFSPGTSGSALQFNFTEFNTENTYDFLYVYDGNSTAAPLIGTYTGTTLPGIISATSASGSLTFRFTSDFATRKPGWKATISCISCPKPTLLTTTILSPTAISLGWTNTIASTSWQVLAQPCGTAAPTALSTGITTTSNPYIFSTLLPLTCYDFYVRSTCSVSDSSTWSAVKTATTPFTCGYVFYDTGGATGDYQNNESTQPTTICPANPGQVVSVTFNSFNTEATYDYLYIYDGSSITDPLINRYSGTTSPGIITSSSGCLTFRFTSDGSTVKAGWKATSSCVAAPTCLKPTSITATSVTPSSVSLGWVNSGVATSFQVLALPCGTAAPTAASTGWTATTSNPTIITGLNALTCYDFYVRGKCSDSDFSSWSGPRTLTTLAPAMPTCVTNPAAGNTCAQAVPICNFNGYCGNTSASYTANYWSGLFDAFCGSIENNSFLSFVASASTITLNFWVTSSTTGSGIQMMVFSAANCAGTVTDYGCYSPGSNGVPFGVPTGVSVLTATGLTPGNTYYLMIDGYGGDVCNYVIGAGSGILTQQVDVTTPNANICIGQSTVLTATGGNSTFTWTCDQPSGSAGLSATSGSSVTFTPTTAGTYTFTATSSDSNPVCPQSLFDTQTITVLNNTLPTFTEVAPICSGGALSALPTTSLNGIAGTWSPPLNNTAASTIYTFTPSPTSGYCTPAIMTIKVNPNLTPTFDDVPAICFGETLSALPTSSTNLPTAIVGTWLPPINSTAPSTLYTFTPTTVCTATATMTIVVNPKVIPSFTTISPFCTGATPPALLLTSSNLINGTWNPSTINNTADATYTFTPDDGQCASTTTMDIQVLNTCTFNTFASAVWLDNCATAGFFNTTGSGVDLIGLAGNVFPNTNLGVYTQNSGKLKFRGGEVKTFKTPTSNVCGVNLNYRIYLQGTLPLPGFTGLPLNTLVDNCSSGTFPSGGPCNPGDQKWQTVSSTTPYPIDLTSYPPGNYKMEVYYDVSGSNTTTTGPCLTTIYLNNGGANYISTFTIQQTPQFAVSNPTLCNATDGKITISGLASNVSYMVSYKDDGTPVGPTAFTSSASGQIIISGLNAGSYTDFLLEYNSCNFPYASVVLVNPIRTPTFVQAGAVCSGTSVSLPPTSIEFITGTWSTPTVSPPSTTFDFNPNPNQCANAASMVVTVNPLPTVTAVNGGNTYCAGDAITNITVDVTGTGNWTVNYTLDGTPMSATGASTPISLGNALGVYVVTNVTDANCTNTANGTQTITVTPLPTVTAVNGGNTYCAGDAITNITVDVTGTANWTVDYTLDGTPMSATGASTPISLGNALGVYVVTNVTDANCTNTANGTQTITVTPNVTPTFAPVAAICSGTPLTLPTSSIELITGTWSPALDNTATTTYTFTPTTGQCPTTALMTVTVNDLPDFTISNGCDGVNYVLSTVVTNGATPSYIWYDALHQPIGISSSITITDEADYSVAVSINGCSKEKSITVSNSFCSIPKGISPNGDGDNDFFDLSNLNVQNLQIFNRYGMEVYSKSDYKKEWNGKTNGGKELPDGTYYYIVNFVTGKTKTGWVYINK